jgi:aminomethyltransferase
MPGHLWDTILSEGKPMGILPTCFTTLDWLRVESYLLFYPYDMSQMYPFEHDPPGDSLWELGLDFTVSPGRTIFAAPTRTRGSRARSASRSSALLVEGKVAADMGDPIYAGDKKVGVVTCAMVLEPDRQIDGDRAPRRTVAVHGTKLEVRGKNVKARPWRIPCRSMTRRRRSAPPWVSAESL